MSKVLFIDRNNNNSKDDGELETYGSEADEAKVANISVYVLPNVSSTLRDPTRGPRTSLNAQEVNISKDSLDRWHSALVASGITELSMQHLNSNPLRSAPYQENTIDGYTNGFIPRLTKTSPILPRGNSAVTAPVRLYILVLKRRGCQFNSSVILIYRPF